MSYNDFDDILKDLQYSFDEINNRFGIEDYDACMDCKYFDSAHENIFGTHCYNYCNKFQKKVNGASDACSSFRKR